MAAAKNAPVAKNDPIVEKTHVTAAATFSHMETDRKLSEGYFRCKAKKIERDGKKNRT